jgi:spore maturation protein CgeB
MSSPMRVLVIGSAFPDSFAENLSVSLADAGHAVRTVPLFPPALLRRGGIAVRLQSDLQALPRLAARAQSRVIDTAEEHAPDVIVNLDGRLAHTTLARLRAASRARVALWFPDHSGNLGREQHVLGGYDALFFKDSAIVDRYRRNLGLNAHYLPEACNPRWHRPIGELAPPTEQPEVVVAGNVYATRFVLIRELARRGIRVRVFGPPWARWLPHEPALAGAWERRQIVREEKARQFRAAPVVLNSMMSQEGDGLNCRLFEATGCGGIVLTEWRARLPELFDVTAEVRAYRGIDELVATAHELSALDADSRGRMSEAASKRAHTEHTYRNRFEAIVRELGRG